MANLAHFPVLMQFVPVPWSEKKKLPPRSRGKVITLGKKKKAAPKKGEYKQAFDTASQPNEMLEVGYIYRAGKAQRRQKGVNLTLLE